MSKRPHPRESEEKCQSKKKRTENIAKKANFNVDKQKCDTEFPFFRKPTEIGAFSLDIDRVFHHDKSQMKYFARPRDFSRVKFDLRHGYQSMIKKDESELSYINDILRWIKENTHKFAVSNPATEADSGVRNRLHIL